jgi:hypothetical protein
MRDKQWLCLDSSFAPIASFTGKSDHNGNFSFKFTALINDESIPIAKVKGRVTGSTRKGCICGFGDDMLPSLKCASIKTGASGVNIYDASEIKIGKITSCFFPAEYKIYSNNRNPDYCLRKDKRFFKEHKNFNKNDFQSVFYVYKNTAEQIDVRIFLSLLVTNGFMSGNGFSF